MALKGNTNAEKIWNFLKSKGLNDCGVAGLMGNLYAESGLIANNLQNSYSAKFGMTDAQYTKAVDNGTYADFVNDSAGYGLAQWTYWSRKEALLECAKKRKASIGDLEMQLFFLVQELESDYKSVFNALKTATTVLQASNEVLLKFERPANQGSSVQKTRASFGQKYYDQFAKKQKESEEISMSIKITTAKQLAEKAINVAKNYKTLYVMGCFGAPMNEANKKRYCENHSYNKSSDRRAMIKAASSDTFGFDCVCLIKGLLWGWCGDKNKTYGGAGYAINGVPDIGADTMIARCSNVSADFSKISVGEAVWVPGHIGIYVGNGLAVECSPKWKNCVQITACNCNKAGYNRRDWSKHGKLPYVSYAGSESVNGSTGTTVGGNAPAKKSVDEIAKEVINGKWGNGEARKKALEAQGYNYRDVQNAVNKKLSGSSAPAQTTKTYTVKKGDSLWAIAAKQLGKGSRYTEIKKLNGLTSDIIHAGQVLKLPNK